MLTAVVLWAILLGIAFDFGQDYIRRSFSLKRNVGAADMKRQNSYGKLQSDKTMFLDRADWRTFENFVSEDGEPPPASKEPFRLVKSKLCQQ